MAVAKSIDIEFVYIHHAKAKLSKLLIKIVILNNVMLRWDFKLGALSANQMEALNQIANHRVSHQFEIPL